MENEVIKREKWYRNDLRDHFGIGDSALVKRLGDLKDRFGFAHEARDEAGNYYSQEQFEQFLLPQHEWVSNGGKLGEFVPEGWETTTGSLATTNGARELELQEESEETSYQEYQEQQRQTFVRRAMEIRAGSEIAAYTLAAGMTLEHLPPELRAQVEQAKYIYLKTGNPKPVTAMEEAAGFLNLVGSSDDYEN